MKRANKEPNSDLSGIEENDASEPTQGSQKDIGSTTNSDHLDTIDLSDPLSGAVMFAAGYSHRNNRFSDAYSISTAQDPARPCTITSLQRPSQLSHLGRSDHPFSYQHQHQQQDSVNSMQQFYYYHSPDDEDEIYSYDCRYGSHELQQHQASRYSQDYHNYREPVYSYHVHGDDHVQVIDQPHVLQVEGFVQQQQQQQQPLSPPYFQQSQPTAQESSLAKSHSSRQEGHGSHINSNGSNNRFIINKTIANLVGQSFHNHSNSTASSSTVSSASLSTSSISSSASTVIQLHLSPNRSRTAGSTRTRTLCSSSPVYNTSLASPPSYSSPSVTTTVSSSPYILGTQSDSPADSITALKKAASRRMDVITVDPRYVTRDHAFAVNQIPVDDCTSVPGSHSSTVLVDSTYNGQGGPGDGGNVSGSAMDEEGWYICPAVDWRAIKDGILPTSSHARNALVATVVVALATITLETILLQRHRAMTASLTGSSGPYEISVFRPLTIYYCIFILAEVFAVGLLWDAAIHKNSLQLVAFTIFEWCMVSYSGLQIWQHDQLMKDIGIPNGMLQDQGDSITRLILFSQLGLQVVAALGITLLTWRLYSEFGWLVFQKLGADVSLRKMMKEYRLLFTLLKLDAFFFFGYAIQIAALTDKHWLKGLTEIAFAIPLSMIIMGLGFCALRKENKATMLGFIACLGLLMVYMVYRLITLYETLTGNPATDPYFFSRKTMTVFASLTLFMTILAFWNAIVMYMNFNKGLKEAMIQYRVRRSGTIRSVTTTTSSCQAQGQTGTHTDTTNSTQGPVRNSRRGSRRKSLLHCESATDSPRQTVVMVERWQIE
ncbi:hypothetical protein BGZ93_007068 [Podila epicladia]|nr:hypothetical protein BGZ93_007068 [Podila epicladia]